MSARRRFRLGLGALSGAPNGGVRPALPAGLLAGVLLVCLVSGSQAAVPAADERKTPTPIEIEADNGIEWRQQEQIVYARGHAKAVRGTLTLYGDVLSARYRPRPDGSNEVWRIESDGAVRITQPNQEIHGDHATYDPETGVLVVTGRKVRLTTPDSEITADQSIEYASKNRLLTARGNAEAKQGERTVRADTLVVTLQDGNTNNSQVKRIEASRNVVVITASEVMRGDQGVYDLDAQRATLTGQVKVTRGENQLNGCRGELDLDFGVGRMFPCPNAGGAAGRVRGLIVPGSDNKE